MLQRSSFRTRWKVVQALTVALSTRIGLIFATKAGIRGNVHKKPPEIRCAFQTNRYLKGFGLFWRHYEVTNGWNSKKKIREAYLYKKIFEITIIRLTMAEIKQFSIIQAFTALWDIKIKEMAAISKSHPICSKIQFSCSCFGVLDQFYPNFVHFNEI